MNDHLAHPYHISKGEFMSVYSPNPNPMPMAPMTRTSVAAIVSLIAGILGIVQVLPVIGPIAAVIAGHMAKSEIKKSGGAVTGNGLATAGLIMGYLMLAIGVCLACIFLLAFAGLITIPFISIPTYNGSY
jgi:hypothetical protein